jgi:hypothetical protein
MQYIEGVSRGESMLYGRLDVSCPDMMILNLGNLLPNQKLIVHLTYV